MRDPYRAAGLANNPFVAEPAPGVALPLWIDRGLPRALSHEPRVFVQIVGPKGAGKTSHLLGWRTTLPGPYRHIGPGRARLAIPPAGDVVYWDEADRSVWLAVALATQAVRRAMVVVGTHRDLSKVARVAGFEVATHHLERLTGDIVRAFAHARITAAGGNPADFDDLDFDAVARRAQASLREAGRLLHIEIARRIAGAGISSA